MTKVYCLQLVMYALPLVQVTRIMAPYRYRTSVGVHKPSFIVLNNIGRSQRPVGLELCYVESQSLIRTQLLSGAEYRTTLDKTRTNKGMTFLDRSAILRLCDCRANISDRHRFHGAISAIVFQDKHIMSYVTCFICIHGVVSVWVNILFYLYPWCGRCMGRPSCFICIHGVVGVWVDILFYLYLWCGRCMGRHLVLFVSMVW